MLEAKEAKLWDTKEKEGEAEYFHEGDEALGDKDLVGMLILALLELELAVLADDLVTKTFAEFHVFHRKGNIKL